MRDKYIQTAESVTEGHPDKLCDTIADTVLDACLRSDPAARVACEVLATAGKILVAGEITAAELPDIPALICRTVREAGYGGSNYEVEVITHAQSGDIAGAVSQEEQTGAGDQGILYGYACSETPELMPLPISLAHKLAKRLTDVRKNGTLDYLRPDGKSQVTVEYEGNRPVRVDAVVISTQHAPEVEMEALRKDILEHVIRPVVPAELLDEQTKYYVNPTGRFVVGGPQGDSGLTGRKIIVDTYGGYGRHGGGAFSGKDPTKVDRSAAYAARWVAKNVVAAGLAEQCEVQLAYAIGVAEPVSIRVDTFGTGAADEAAIEAAVEQVFDLRPASIIEQLGLRRPIYRQLAAYGHMGREELGVAWEQTDKAGALRAAMGL